LPALPSTPEKETSMKKEKVEATEEEVEYHVRSVDEDGPRVTGGTWLRRCLAAEVLKIVCADVNWADEGFTEKDSKDARLRMPDPTPPHRPAGT
jgi:peptide methionine sulfoxide reductase MsrB